MKAAGEDGDMMAERVDPPHGRAQDKNTRDDREHHLAVALELVGRALAAGPESPIA